MSFSGISYFAVLIAAVAAFFFGALWYTMLGKQWMAAAGLTEADIEAAGGRKNPQPFIVAGISQLVIAFMLAGIMGHVGRVDFAGGLVTAFSVWLGFVATTLAVNHRFQTAPWSLTVIDGGHWLGGMLLQGAIIGLIGA